MSVTKNIKIISMGVYLPKKISSNQLESQYHLEKGWSERYSGVRYRHHVTSETNAYMGAQAIECALEKSPLTLSDIDLIISASATYDHPLPNQSSLIKSELKDGLHYNIPTIDIDTTCLSFITSFEIASKMIDNSQYKNIIIVSSEVASKGLNSNNPETLTLFGDAAVAAIFSYDDKQSSNFIKGAMNTYSEGVFHTMIKGGGNKYFFKDYPYDEELYSFQMDGKKLLKLAKKELNLFVNNFFDNIEYNIEDVDVIIPHQTSKMGHLLFRNSFNLDESKIMNNLLMQGNCIAASVPLTLYQSIVDNKIKRGDLCLLIGTSAGFSIGALLFKY